MTTLIIWTEMPYRAVGIEFALLVVQPSIMDTISIRL